MIKHTRTESAPEVVSPEAHKAIEASLHRLSKTSARELSDSQREQVRNSLDTTDSE